MTLSVDYPLDSPIVYTVPRLDTSPLNMAWLNLIWQALKPISAPTWLVASLLFSSAALTGCDTLGQDLKDIGGVFSPTTPSEAARHMVDPYDADNRRTGVELISNAPFGGVEVYVKTYRDMVDNERDPVVKAIAIRALARHGAPEDAMRILPHLSHENVQVRWEAAKGLQRLHNEAVIPDLLKALNADDEHSDVRIAAATALGQYPQDRVFQGLVRALDARELAINLAAGKSLYDLTGEDFGIDPPAWLAWYNSAGSARAFANPKEYLYPTYSRGDLWWEKIMFWTSRNWEKPGLPAGLRPADERKTYQDESSPATQATQKSATQ